MHKRRLYLVHVQGKYGPNQYPPFSVGCLWAYARQFSDITDAYEMVDFLYLKEPIEKAIARLDRPDIVGLAHYIWNAEWNMQFARAVKAKFPNCTIIVGGVQVHDESPRTLEECEAFDFAVYGEGEGAFADFLRAHAAADLNDVFFSSYQDVGSLIWRWNERININSDASEIVVNPRRDFVPLEDLRSPYLDGVFDDLWAREPRWQILQETTRGCPYLCSFCAWGQAALAELRPFPAERVFGEIDWFGKRKVDYLDNADANFGITKRDVEIARQLAATKAKYGFPKTFRTSFAKNSNDTIWEIANIFHDAKMLKSVTLAMQSMDEGVLVNIKRKNIKFSKFGELVARYEAAGIPTYTELILGLAGETLDMFLDGIDKNLDAGQHSGLFTYLNLVLNNTEQSTLEYRQVHGIESLAMPAMLSHGTPDPAVPRERQEVVIATAAMPHEDWRKGFLHGRVIEAFHSMGLLQDVAIAAHGRGVSYRDFYSGLIAWMRSRPETVAGDAFANIEKVLDRALAGGLWDCVDPILGDISWPPEEFAFARICLELDKFYDEVEEYLVTLPLTGDEIAMQRQQLVRPGGDIPTWARETVWYGRRGYQRKMRSAS